MHRMRRDMRKFQDELVARQAKPVKLRVVAAMAHHELTGRKREAVLARDYFAELDKVAASLAQVADIYYVNAARRVLRIAAEDLAAGRFENGADVFRTAGGEVCLGLSMRRGDAMDAIAALKISRAALAAQAEKSGAA